MEIQTPMYVMYNGRILSEYTEVEPLVHCNWGWAELGLDGYYYDDAFNSNNGPVTRAHTDTFGTEGNFQYNIECIVNVYK